MGVPMLVLQWFRAIQSLTCYHPRVLRSWAERLNLCVKGQTSYVRVKLDQCVMGWQRFKGNCTQHDYVALIIVLRLTNPEH